MPFVRGLLLSHLCASWLAQADRSDTMVLDVDADADGLTRESQSSLADLHAVETQSRSLISHNRSLLDMVALGENDVPCRTLTLFQDVNQNLYSKRNELPKPEGEGELDSSFFKELTGDDAMRACCSRENVKQARIERKGATVEEFLKNTEYRSLVLPACRVKKGSFEGGCQCDQAYVLHMVNFHKEPGLDDDAPGIVNQSLLKRFQYLTDTAKDLNEYLQKTLNTKNLNDYANDAVTKAKIAANLTHKYTKNLEGLQHGGKMFVKRLNDYHRGNNFDVFAALNDGSLSALDSAYKSYVKRHGQGDAEFTAFKTNLEAMGHTAGKSYLGLGGSGEQWYESHSELQKLVASWVFIDEMSKQHFQEDLQHLVKDYTPQTESLEDRLDRAYALWKKIEDQLKGRDIDPQVAQGLKRFDQIQKEFIRWLFEEENRYLLKLVEEKHKPALKFFEALSYLKNNDEINDALKSMPFFDSWRDEAGDLKKLEDIEAVRSRDVIVERYAFMRENWEEQTQNKFLVYTDLGKKELSAVQAAVASEEPKITWDYMPFALIQILSQEKFSLMATFPMTAACPVKYQEYPEQRMLLMNRLFGLAVLWKTKENCPKELEHYCAKLMAEREVGRDWSTWPWPNGVLKDNKHLNVEDKVKIELIGDQSIFGLSEIDVWTNECDLSGGDREVMNFKRTEEAFKLNYKKYLYRYEREELRKWVEKRVLKPNALALFQTIEFESNADDVFNLITIGNDYSALRESKFFERYGAMRETWKDLETPWRNVAHPGGKIPKDSNLGVLQILMKLPLNIGAESWSMDIEAERNKRLLFKDKVRKARAKLYQIALEKTLSEQVFESDKEFSRFFEEDPDNILWEASSSVDGTVGRPEVHQWEDEIHTTKQEFDRWLYEAEHKALNRIVSGLNGGVGPLAGLFKKLDDEKDLEHVRWQLYCEKDEVRESRVLCDELETPIKERYRALRLQEEPIMDNHRTITGLDTRTHRTLMTLPLKYGYTYMQAQRDELSRIANDDKLSLEEKKEGEKGSDAIFKHIIERFEKEKTKLGSDYTHGRDQVIKAEKDYNKQLFLKENKLVHGILVGEEKSMENPGKGVSRPEQSVWQYFEEEEDPRNVMNLLDYEFYTALEKTTRYRARYLYLRQHFSKAVGLPYQKYRIVIKETIDLDTDLGVLKMLMALPYSTTDEDALNFDKVKAARRNLYDIAVRDNEKGKQPYEKDEDTLKKRTTEAKEVFKSLTKLVTTMDVDPDADKRGTPKTREDSLSDLRAAKKADEYKKLAQCVDLDQKLKSVESDYYRWLVKRENKVLYEKMKDASTKSAYEKYLEDYEKFADIKPIAQLRTAVNKMQDHLNRGLDGKGDHQLKECKMQDRYMELRRMWLEVTDAGYENHRATVEKKSQVQYNMKP